MRRKFQGDGLAIATLLYGPQKAPEDPQTSLDLDSPQPPEQEEEKE